MKLSEKQLQHFRLHLQQLKADLLDVEKSGEQAEQVVELDQTRIGRLSRMDAMQAQAMSVETGRRRKLHVLEIEAALKRVDAGEYGDCLECGELINPKRLEADPGASLCINCAESME